MVVEPITHIERDEHGVPWIAGTNTKVVEVAMDQRAFGWDAEEIRASHPHLSAGQIHAALSYYHDHKSALDAEMDRTLEEFKRERASAPGQLTRAELSSRAK